MIELSALKKVRERIKAMEQHLNTHLASIVETHPQDKACLDTDKDELDIRRDDLKQFQSDLRAIEVELKEIGVRIHALENWFKAAVNTKDTKHLKKHSEAFKRTKELISAIDSALKVEEKGGVEGR